MLSGLRAQQANRKKAYTAREVNFEQWVLYKIKGIPFHVIGLLDSYGPSFCGCFTLSKGFLGLTHKALEQTLIFSFNET